MIGIENGNSYSKLIKNIIDMIWSEKYALKQSYFSVNKCSINFLKIILV